MINFKEITVRSFKEVILKLLNDPKYCYYSLDLDIIVISFQIHEKYSTDFQAIPGPTRKTVEKGCLVG